jgi:hypothetical protein
LLLLRRSKEEIRQRLHSPGQKLRLQNCIRLCSVSVSTTLKHGEGTQHTCIMKGEPDSERCSLVATGELLSKIVDNVRPDGWTSRLTQRKAERGKQRKY